MDCGAYVGDTAEDYVWKCGGLFQGITAIEPDSRNAEVCRIRFERLRREWNLRQDQLRILQTAVGEHTERKLLKRDEKNHGIGSQLADKGLETTGERIEISSIDDIFRD